MIGTSTIIGVLPPWHTRQAAMLYHYSSLDYLKRLHYLVGQMIDGVVNPLLDLAKQQGRDSVLTNLRWGTRDTSSNWSNNAWPILKDLQQSLTKDIATRSFDRYAITGVSECLRGADQFSMQWATELEEQQYKEFTQLINDYARRIPEQASSHELGLWRLWRYFVTCWRANSKK